MPVPKKMVNIKRQSEALRRLRVSRADVAMVPRITPLLKMADGGIEQVLDAIRFAPDETTRAFLKKYDSIPVGDRNNLPIEAIALAAGVDISNLLGSIMVALQQQSVSLVKMIAMTAHPKITMSRVVFGQMPSGDKDRLALDQAMGFLPLPKGPTFIGKAVFGSGKTTMDTQNAGSDEDDEVTAANENEPDLDKLFPPANEMQQELIAIRQKLLPPTS
jgi:hypothetical protein